MSTPKERDLERIVNNKASLSESDTLFMKFSSDYGTILNMGRRGSCYAPEAILNIVKKMASHNLLKWSEVEIVERAVEESDFASSQALSSKKIEKILKEHQRAGKFIYLGGGHDHVYPALKALNTLTKKMVVINIDAHLDTRTDEHPNSGTPFRQIAREFDGEIEIVQIGIHDFANSISTMSNLPKGKERVMTYEDVRYGTKNFSNSEKFLRKVLPLQKEALYFFSLDADALDAGIMEGVSAVNHRGLPYDFVEEILIYAIDELKCAHFGLYEYNPVYDNLSQKGARALAALVYQILDDRNF
jgi:formiminoglutamase